MLDARQRMKKAKNVEQKPKMKDLNGPQEKKVIMKPILTFGEPASALQSQSQLPFGQAGTSAALASHKPCLPQQQTTKRKKKGQKTLEPLNNNPSEAHNPPICHQQQNQTNQLQIPTTPDHHQPNLCHQISLAKQFSSTTTTIQPASSSDQTNQDQQEYKGASEGMNTRSRQSKMYEWQRREEEMQTLQFLCDEYTLIQVPTQYQPGSFSCKVGPNCGTEEPCCHLEMTVKFIITPENTSQAEVKVETVSQSQLSFSSSNADSWVQFELPSDSMSGLSPDQQLKVKLHLIEVVTNKMIDIKRKEVSAQRGESEVSDGSMSEDEKEVCQNVIDRYTTEDGRLVVCGPVMTYDVIKAMRDLLGTLNPHTTLYLKKQMEHQLGEERKEREQKRILEQKRAQRLVHDFEIKLKKEILEEKRWFETLANKKVDEMIRNAQTLGPSILQVQKVASSNREEKDKSSNKESNAQKENNQFDKVKFDKQDEEEKHEHQKDHMLLSDIAMTSRYHSDFDEICKIGQGGFGSVFKARHRLDGNIYAIKKIKLSNKLNSEENLRIRREVTYLSSLNNQYIVRYFQTWVEHETDPDVIKEFEDEDDYDDEYTSEITNSKSKSSDSFELIQDSFDQSRFQRQRSSSYNKRNERNVEVPFQKLQGVHLNEAEIHQYKRERSRTDMIQIKPKPKADIKSSQDSYSESESDSDEELVKNEKKEDYYEFSDTSPAKDSGGQNSKQEGIKILYIQMQYCEGRTFEDFCKENPDRKQEQIKWKIFRQICEAVSYLQSHRIIHRDIKPENVFLDQQNNAKLGDFGLAKRLNLCQNQEEDNNYEFKNLTKQNLRNSELKQSKGLTTGVGTLRFAAPEQKINKKKGFYGYKADVYSLGVVLLDTFRNHNISFQELDEIHTEMLQGRVKMSIAKKMPQNAVTLIERMINEDPNQRPSINQILTSELLPQEGILNELIPHLENHKNPIKLQLMSILGLVKVPRALDLTYFGDYDYHPCKYPTIELQKQVSLNAQANQKKKLQQNHQQNNPEASKERIILKQGILQGLCEQIRVLFLSNGSREILDLQDVYPLQHSSTIFLSKPIRLVHLMPQIDVNSNLTVREQVTKILGDKDKTKFLTEDFLKQEDEQVSNGQTVSVVKSQFTFKLPDSHLRSNCWQELRVLGRQGTQSQHVSKQFKLLDENGIVLAMQRTSIHGIARQIATRSADTFQKMFKIGTVFRASESKHNLVEGLGPRNFLEAALVLTQRIKKQRSETQSLAELSEQEIMMEVDILRQGESIIRNSLPGAKYELRVSSSEVLDAIFEECNIELSDRAAILHMLAKMQPYNNIQLQKEVNLSIFKTKYNLTKMQDLLSLRGTTAQIEKQIKQKQGILWGRRLLNALNYFKIIEDRLKLFDIYSESQENSDNLRLLQKEKTRNQSISLESEEAQKAGLKKTKSQKESLDLNLKNQSQNQTNSAVNITKFSSSQQSTLQNRKNVGKSKIQNASRKDVLVFDFGLILEDYANFYSGLNFAITQKHSTKKVNKGQIRAIRKEIVLACGGRFDNLVAHYQMELHKNLPACVGLLVNVTKLAVTMATIENPDKLKTKTSLIDMVIGSVDSPAIQEKIYLMEKMQKEGFKVHVDFSDDWVTGTSEQFLNVNNVRFIVLVQEDSRRITYRDRFTVATSTSLGSTAYHEVKNTKFLIEELKMLSSQNVQTLQ